MTETGQTEEAEATAGEAGAAAASPDKTGEQTTQGEGDAGASQERAAAAAADGEKKMDETQRARFAAEYAEAGNYVRHYSTVRATLTTFLLTAGIAAFSAYVDKDAVDRVESTEFFVVVGHLFLSLSLFVCILFSFRSTHMRLYQKRLWEFSNGAKSPAGECRKFPAGYGEIKIRHTLSRVVIDPLNHLLLLIVALTSCFFMAYTPLEDAPRADWWMGLYFWSIYVAVVGIELWCVLGVARFFAKVWIAISKSVDAKRLWRLIPTADKIGIVIGIAIAVVLYWKFSERLADIIGRLGP
jgi:hypothetical protein